MRGVGVYTPSAEQNTTSAHGLPQILPVSFQIAVRYKFAQIFTISSSKLDSLAQHKLIIPVSLRHRFLERKQKVEIRYDKMNLKHIHLYVCTTPQKKKWQLFCTN